MRSARLVLGSMVVLSLLMVGRADGGGSGPLPGPEDRIWLFNFAPESTRNLEGFVKVSARTAYDKTKGFGWVDLDGKLMTGTFKDAKLPWESFDNLNVICRRGPDDIGRTHVTGPATFALDLPRGKYEVWVLVGDLGALDYVPHEPFRVKVENRRTDVVTIKDADFLKAWETPLPDDLISSWEAYVRYVKPRFRWQKAEVTVRDGQLSVTVECKNRSAESVSTELGLGPAKRYTGALAAMMVTPETSHKVFGLNRTEMIEAYRRENFRRRFRRIYTPPTQEIKPTREDTRRGYVCFFPNLGENLAPGTARPHDENPITLRATPGEYVPLTFALHALRDYKSVSVRTGNLTKKKGRISSKAFDVGQVRYCAQMKRTEGGGHTWQPVAHQIVPANKDELPAGATRQYWLTLHVPDDAEAGLYSGRITVAPWAKASSSIDVEVEVLPFVLKHPEQSVAGDPLYYIPATVSFLPKDTMWKRVRADLADIRAHGLTRVALNAVDDKGVADKFVAICKDLGITQVAHQPNALPFNRYQGLPSDFFDVGGQSLCLAYPGPKFSVISTLKYERIRRQENYAAYFLTLYQLMAAAPDSPAKTEVQAVFGRAHAPKALPMPWGDARNKIIDAILKLVPAETEPKKIGGKR